MQGRVKGRQTEEGYRVNEDENMEQEAEQKGEKAKAITSQSVIAPCEAVARYQGGETTNDGK